VHAAFGTVIWVVCVVGIVAAVASLIFSGKTWEEHGRSRLSLDHDSPPSQARASAGAFLERDAEIRQLLEARNARRHRRGEPPVDVEAELRRLTAPAVDVTAPAVDVTAPAVDDALRGEIRDLVIARNFRRVRAGKPPLDVDAEVDRELQSLSDAI
jgi:hypothetical protein